MQRRKKLLVIIMWITVLAFVGAGFVGWGSYQYGSKSSGIASVGDVQIKRDDLQSEYNKLYSYYNQLFDGNLPQAQAEELKSIAMQRLINQAYLLNLADEFGVIVSDDEIAQTITGMEEFKADGVFSKEQYQKVLAGAQMTIAKFEESIRKDILLNKLADMFSFDVAKSEFDTVASSLFLTDNVNIQILDEKDIKVTVPDADVTAYWEKNKDRYMGEPTFDIGYITVAKSEFTATEADAKDYYEKNRAEFMSFEAAPKKFEEIKDQVMNAVKMKMAKKEALKKRIALKKGKVEAVIANAVPLTNTIVPLADMKSLESKASMEVSKPIETENGYVVVKLLNRYTPKPLSFAVAKPKAKADLMVEKMQVALDQEAAKMLKNFNGTSLGFITRNDMNKIKSLTTEEASLFLSNLFNSKEKKGYVNLGKKAVLFEIVEQKLLSNTKVAENRDFITSNVKRMKKTLIDSEMIEYLQNTYEVQKYYEGM